MKLPDEIILHVVSLCDWHSKLQLRQVSRSTRIISNSSIEILPIPIQSNELLAGSPPPPSRLSLSPFVFLMHLLALVVSQCTNITKIELSGPNINNLGMAALRSLGKLETLVLTQLKSVTDEALFNFKHLTSLTDIHVESVRSFTKYSIEIVHQFTQLKSLYWSDIENATVRCKSNLISIPL